jgi:cell division protein FtsA
MEGSPFHTAVLPLGGNNVTNDIAIGLKTSLAAAEDLKIRVGTADPSGVDKDEQVDVAGIGEGDASSASRYELALIIEARMREVFEKIGEQIEKAGTSGMLPAGLVLTGGAAQLTGAARLGREVLQTPDGPGPAHLGRADRPRRRVPRLRIDTRAGRPGPHARLGPWPSALVR